MAEHFAICAVTDFLRDNAESLVRDLWYAGNPVEIQTISSTHLTPPTKYIHIAVDAPSVDFQNFAGSNLNSGPLVAEVPIQILVADEIVITSSERHPFEEGHEAFRMVCDRIAAKIKSNVTFTDSVSTVKFKHLLRGIDEPLIAKRNSTQRWNAQEGFYARMLSLIDFRLISECISESDITG